MLNLPIGGVSFKEMLIGQQYSVSEDVNSQWAFWTLFGIGLVIAIGIPLLITHLWKIEEKERAITQNIIDRLGYPHNPVPMAKEFDASLRPEDRIRELAWLEDLMRRNSADTLDSRGNDENNSVG